MYAQFLNDICNNAFLFKKDEVMNQYQSLIFYTYVVPIYYVDFSQIFNINSAIVCMWIYTCFHEVNHTLYEWKLMLRSQLSHVKVSTQLMTDKIEEHST